MEGRPPAPAVLCIDLGKTSTRYAVLESESDGSHHVDEGHPGAAHDGPGLLTHLVQGVRSHSLRPFVAIGVGAAGTLTAPAAAERLAVGLRDEFGFPAAVTSDIVTAHAGAFGGGPGVVLIAGTGAVALGVDLRGAVRRVDGWGPEIGDVGGGSWIGREAVRAVLTATATGRDATSLAGRVRGLLGSAADPVAAVASSENPGRLLASIAPAVLEEARLGDAIAAGIIARAVDALARTAQGAAGFDPAPVALLGGLTDDPVFRAALEEALRARALTPVPARASALAGARLIALRADLPFEEYIHRA